MKSTPVTPPNKKRACMKIAALAVIFLLVLGVMFGMLDNDVLDELKHTLSLWSVVALVVIINLVSFVCFVACYAAYKWVRRDLKPRRDEDLDL